MANIHHKQSMISVIEFDGRLTLIPEFISASDAARYCQRLVDELDWATESIRLYGKTMQSPRLVSWYGDPGANYRYSGLMHSPRPWHVLLDEIKNRLETFSGRRFNSVLCNLYRNGNDSMGWHADKEKELGMNPYIGSLSLGESRLFRIRHCKTGKTHDLELGSGSLLIMSEELQRHWRHCIPKFKTKESPRINLSFRKIICGSGTDSPESVAKGVGD